MKSLKLPLWKALVGPGALGAVLLCQASGAEEPPAKLPTLANGQLQLVRQQPTQPTQPVQPTQPTQPVQPPGAVTAPPDVQPQSASGLGATGAISSNLFGTAGGQPSAAAGGGAGMSAPAAEA